MTKSLVITNWLLITMPGLIIDYLFSSWLASLKNRYHCQTVEPDETAHNELSHQDLHCLPFRVLTGIPWHVQIQRWKISFQKIKGFIASSSYNSTNYLLKEKAKFVKNVAEVKDLSTHYENMPIQIYWAFYHQKMKTVGWKILVVFIFLLKTYDCGYLLKLPLWGGSNITHNLCVLAEIRKMGFKGVKNI